ncbi:Iota-carrageenase precursor [Planctomycetes bacterium CA13]|uniref:Iota-carrageenase n=1 Tax=Novipirellula herctigrandis TaxID=2527986 RepID=A0A5C5Z249_9BACT|nr:Iota-carrageenase precursor [Planctomycetes bacterium CA13]
MDLTSRLILLTLLAFGFATTASAEYTETMAPNGPIKKVGSDYGLVDDNAKTNQSDVLQKAIDDVAALGGGRLVIPKGTYRFAGILLKSNVHLLIEKDTVIKPFWPEGTKAVVFNLDAERPSKKKQMTLEQEQAFIENVSIRGLGGRWIIDYSDRERQKGDGVRGILAKMVRNFLIADLDVKDNYSTYCGITLTPIQTDNETKDWPVSRATDGTVRNCRIFNASAGYGLTQLHGAQTVHFEDLYAEGGVTLRMETGAVGDKTAIYDITGKNIVNENGRCAVMCGPHSAMNGVVKIEGIKSIGSAFAVQIGSGGVKAKELINNPDAVDGIFAKGSYVKNIHAIFGMHGQVKTHAFLGIPEEYYDDLNLRWENKFFDGPSIGAVVDSSADQYDMIIENVTMEGFKYNADKPILTEADFPKGKWGAAVSKWKSDHGISGETDKQKNKKAKKKAR